MFNKTGALIRKHKVISAIVVIVLLVVIYYGYGAIFTKKAATSYATKAATNGTITTSVSGSGQVSALSSISLQFQASGTLTYLPVKNGDIVSQGQLIAELDTTTAQQSITNDESQLKSAQISLEKLEGPATLTTPQNEQDATNTLNQDYQSGYNAVSNSFTDLPSIMTDLKNVVYGNDFNSYQQNIDFYASTANSYDPNATEFKNSLTASYQKALTEYTQNFNDYKSISRSSDNATIDSMVSETYNTARDVSQAIKDTNNLIQFYENTLTTFNIKINPTANTQLTTVNNDSGKATSDLTNLLNIQSTINTDKESVSDASLNLQSAQLSVQNSQTSLANDKSNLENYYIYAPFAGTLGKITAEVGSQVGSGTSIATILTNQKICVIPLNEVDAAKVQPGQQVILTFNALPSLTVAGQVATIDPVGTVSSGVVTYNVQINFDTQDTRVKSGMSINAEIITNIATNVLTVPNSAVKTQGSIKYVQVLVNNTPQQKIVTVGLSNDTNTQILSGLNAGDKVVTQTISGSSTTNATTTTTGTGTRAGSFGGGAGGAIFRGGL